MSIPKIIHYCWLSNDPIPESLQRCMDSWKKYLPDYEFLRWNFDRFDINSSVWVKEAFEAKKYAFAADYIRCYALYHYGGIYLDMDVEVLKPFDDLLNLPYFLCQECDRTGIEAAVMGAKKKTSLFEKMVEYYAEKHFICGDTYDTRVLPEIMESIIQSHFRMRNIKDIQDFDYSRDVVSVLPTDWFSPKSFSDGKIYLTNNTYTIHHFAGSWLNEEDTFFIEFRKKLFFLPRIWRRYIAKFISICKFHGVAAACWKVRSKISNRR